MPFSKQKVSPNILTLGAEDRVLQAKADLVMFGDSAASTRGRRR